MIQIYDNILTLAEQDHVENFLRDPKFPWYLAVNKMHHSVDQETFLLHGDEDTRETLLLGHDFYRNSQRNSENYKLSDFILDRFLSNTGIKIQELIRSKANLQSKAAWLDRLHHTTPHVDSLLEHTILIYYANDTDGNTVIFDRIAGDSKTQYNIIKEVEPKKGRFLLFNGKYYHAAKFALEHDIRLNINFNFV
jgi:hypothetical protein